MIGRADFGSYGFTAATHRRLSDQLSQATFVDLEGVSDTLQLSKSPAEIAWLSRAAAIADTTMETLRAFARPGLTTRELAADSFLRLGADSGETGPILVSRGDYAFLHSRMAEKALAAETFLVSS